MLGARTRAKDTAKQRNPCWGNVPKGRELDGARGGRVNKGPEDLLIPVGGSEIRASYKQGFRAPTSGVLPTKPEPFASRCMGEREEEYGEDTMAVN